MAFKGDLKDFELREIMRFIGERVKDGQLMLKTDDRQAIVEFGKGKITRLTLYEKPVLAFRLEEAGFVPAGTAAKLNGAESDDISQRQLILSKKLVEKDDFNRFLVREIAKDLAEILFWEEAEFEFVNAEEPPPPLVELKVEDAVREAISMSVKLRNLKKRFPDGMSLCLSKSPVEKLVTIDPEEWEIIARFTKKINVEDLARVSGLDGFSFFELLARIADRGLLSVEEAEHAEKAEKTEKKTEVESKPELKPEQQEKKQQPQPAPINGKYIAVA